VEPWIDRLSPHCAPKGFLEWSRAYETWEEGWDACPDPEWRLWLAILLASDAAKQLECARAAFHVARTMIALVPDARPLVGQVIDLSEEWAETRSTDDPLFDAVDELDEPTTMPHEALHTVVGCAAWFADFEACAGVDGACNAIDLFTAARELALYLGVEGRVLPQLAQELRAMLARPAPAPSWIDASVPRDGQRARSTSGRTRGNG
jgi:hypothetical protein